MQDIFPNFDPGVELLWPLEVQEDRSSWAQSIASAVGVGIAFGLLCAAGRFLCEDSQHVATVFAADGVLTAFLLWHPRRCWGRFLLAAWLGDVVSMWVLRAPPGMSLWLPFCNAVEVAIAALLLRAAVEKEKDLVSPGMMVKFLLFAIGLAPAVSGMMASVYYHFAFGSRIWDVWGKWFPPYSLGMAVMLPLTLALRSSQRKAVFSRTRWFRTAGILLLVAAVSLEIFQHERYSLRFFWLPLLMLVVFEAGIVGGILATFEILIVGALYTLRGAGPFWLMPHATLQRSVWLMQAAVLMLLISTIPFAAVLERQKLLRARLRLELQRYQLLAENSRDIVVLASLEGRRLYVSPAVRDVLGWTQDEWTGRSAADFIHHEDLDSYYRLLKEMLRGEDRQAFRYRTRHKDGRYLWMEANVRPLSEGADGEPTAFVANLREITERVESEQRLVEAHELIQQQVDRDSLTQLANRRCFDAALEREWRRGRRTGNPIALLMIDLDHFKSVNDTYGHRAGDQCLQTLAEILRKTGRRPSDLAARYGGEEFAILLPDVNLVDATVLADMLCMHVRAQLFEAGIGRALELTVSVGVAAMVPTRNARADLLVETADRALYAAKEGGRNRVVADRGKQNKAELSSSTVNACPVSG